MVCTGLPSARLRRIPLAMDTVWCKPHQRPSCEEHVPCSESQAAPPSTHPALGYSGFSGWCFGEETDISFKFLLLLSTGMSMYYVLTACLFTHVTCTILHSPPSHQGCGFGPHGTSALGSWPCQRPLPRLSVRDWVPSLAP